MNSVNQFDPNAFASQQFDRLNSLASRGDEIAANRVANSLFSSGRLGANDTATGLAFEGLARGQENARTERALEATNMANSEAQRLFDQQQTGILNQFGMLNSLTGQGQNQFNNLFTQTGGNNSFTQQALLNAMGFGGAAGNVLNPNFQTLTAVMNRQATDQSARAGVASNNASIMANNATSNANMVGNAFAGIGQGIMTMRNREEP